MIRKRVQQCANIAYALLRLIKLFFEHGRAERKTLRVLVAHEFSPTGASLLLGHLCMEYAQRGDVVVIITENTGKLSPTLQPYLRHAACLLRISSLHSRLVFQFLRKLGAQAVLLNTVVTGTFACPARKAGLRTISLIHEMTASLEIINAKPLADDILRYADAVVFPARAVLNAFCSFAQVDQNHPKMHILPQGYYKGIQTMPPRDECREWVFRQLCLDTRATVLLGAGAINFGKGIDMVLPALQRLNQDGGDYHLVWLGVGAENDPFSIWLRVQINAMELKNRVHFIGFIDEPKAYMRWLRGADIFILSSREDAFPSVVIEASIAQLPIIAFEGSGGGADIVNSNGLGICVPMGDESALCEAIRGITKSCLQAKQLSDQYSFPRYAAALLTY